jgi:hypothetical protein
MVAPSKMTVAQLAEYASRELRLPERECYRYEGGPLPRKVLLHNIEQEHNKSSVGYK